MYDPDIDIVVKCRNPRKSSLEALGDFIAQRGFQKYEYGDFVKFKRRNRPQGFIVNLHHNTTTIKWEIEIWFLKSVEKYLEMKRFLFSKITKSNRIKILKLKEQCSIKKIDKHKLSSIYIYRKIILKKKKYAKE